MADKLTDFRFHPSRLKYFVCAFLIAPMIGGAVEDAALQKSATVNSSSGGFDAHAPGTQRRRLSLADRSIFTKRNRSVIIAM